MKRLLTFSLTLLTVFICSTAWADNSTTLNQYISDLQKNPNDYALREKIIKHVQTMRPAPAIPEEARRHYVMALTLFKGARKIEDYWESFEEFKSALLVAPWWAEANRDLGMALEAAKRYDEAINALKLYMASGPGEEKARAAQDEIYKIEGMKKLAARERKESSPQAVAAKKQNEFEQWLKKLDGRRYTSPVGSGQTGVIDVRGKVFVNGIIGESGKDVYREDNRIEIQGRETTVRFSTSAPFLPVAATFIISEDGDRITYRKLFSDGDVREFIYLWQR